MLNLNLAVRPGGVHLRVPLGSPNHGGGKHQQRGHLNPLKMAGLFQSLHKFHGAGGVHIHENRNVRGAKRRRHHSLRSGLTHPPYGDAFKTVTGYARGLPEPAAGFLHIVQVRHIVQQVLFRHLPPRTGRGHIRQVHPHFLSGQAHRRGGKSRTMRHGGGSILLKCWGLGTL